MLNVPQADRHFFRKYYFSKTCVKEKQNQLDLLNKYKDRTSIIIQKIDQRETAMTSVKQFLKETETDFCKFECKIVKKLRHFRNISISVLEAIKSWREVMWSPHPFLWNSQNYILKMSKDYSELLDYTLFVRLQPFVSDFIFFLPATLSKDSLEIVSSNEEDCTYNRLS